MAKEKLGNHSSVGQIGFFNLGIATDLEEGKLWILTRLWEG